MSLFQPLSNYQVSSRDKTLDLSQPHIMGILNVTPDSFSDGGQFNASVSIVVMLFGYRLILAALKSCRQHLMKVLTFGMMYEH
mgnify:CR=1 FL=1